MPIVDDDGALAGVMTERTLARRYIRESREATSLADAAASVAGDRRRHSRASSSSGEEREIAGRVWVLAMDVDSLPGRHRRGRRRRRRQPRPTPSAARSSSASRCSSRATARARPTRCSRSRRERGTTVVSSPLDSYVTSRMVTLSAPCRALMDAEPLTVRPDDLLSDVAEEVNGRSTTARRSPSTARAGRSGSSPTPSSLDPEPRRVLLVDHAEQAQSVARRRAGRDRRDPRPPPHRLDRDAASRCARRSTRSARPRRSSSSASARTAWSRRRSTAIAAARRGPVGHGDPQLADDDRARPRRGRVPRARARRSTPRDFGREMFEETSDVSERRRRRRSSRRDAKEYAVGDGPDARASRRSRRSGCSPRPPRRAARGARAPARGARLRCSTR